MIADVVSALGMMIAFYYGLTGFACVWYYRRTLTHSQRDLLMRGLIPLLGGLMMFFALAWSLRDDWVYSDVDDQLHELADAVLAALDHRRGVPLGIGTFVVGRRADVHRAGDHRRRSSAARRSTRRRRPWFPTATGCRRRWTTPKPDGECRLTEFAASIEVKLRIPAYPGALEGGFRLICELPVREPDRMTRRGGAEPDELGKAIIEQLQEDGRRPYASIGQAVGLSEAAVRQRVQKLVDSGVMQIVAVTDPMQIGFARQAMIGISATGDIEAIAEQLAEIDEVDYIVITAGSFDILAEVVVEDDDHLLGWSTAGSARCDGVTRTETFLYLKLVKQTYNWGAR